MALKHPHVQTRQPRQVVAPPLFSLEAATIPRHELPAGEMPPDVAYQIVHDELMLDGNARLNVATQLSERIAGLGPFELLTRGNELPVFAFTLKEGVENFTVFDVSNALRERGWQVPAYTFPEHRTDLAALRVVVRRGFTHDMADMLVHDLERQLVHLKGQPAPRHDKTTGTAFAH